jgi:hypothetical protein
MAIRQRALIACRFAETCFHTLRFGAAPGICPRVGRAPLTARNRIANH